MMQSRSPAGYRVVGTPQCGALSIPCAVPSTLLPSSYPCLCSRKRVESHFVPRVTPAYCATIGQQTDIQVNLSLAPKSFESNINQVLHSQTDRRFSPFLFGLVTYAPIYPRRTVLLFNPVSLPAAPAVPCLTERI